MVPADRTDLQQVERALSLVCQQILATAVHRPSEEMA
jgi:hypothetical protein